MLSCVVIPSGRVSEAHLFHCCLDGGHPWLSWPGEMRSRVGQGRSGADWCSLCGVDVPSDKAGRASAFLSLPCSERTLSNFIKPQLHYC